MAIKFNLISPRSSEKTKEQATACQMKTIKEKKTQKKTKKHVEVTQKKLTISHFKNMGLRDYAHKNNEIEENSPFVKLHFGSKFIVVRKTSFCWKLQDDVVKLSNNRLFRVRSNKHRQNAVNMTDFKCPKPIKKKKKHPMYTFRY